PGKVFLAWECHRGRSGPRAAERLDVRSHARRGNEAKGIYKIFPCPRPVPSLGPARKKKRAGRHLPSRPLASGFDAVYAFRRRRARRLTRPTQAMPEKARVIVAGSGTILAPARENSVCLDSLMPSGALKTTLEMVSPLRLMTPKSKGKAPFESALMVIGPKLKALPTWSYTVRVNVSWDEPLGPSS